jgi:hypothetical protein
MNSHNARSQFSPLRRGEEEEALLQRAAAWPDHSVLESLDAATLRQITTQEGVDFATALLFDRFRNSARHSAFVRQINALCNGSHERLRFDVRVVIVPAALYVERPDMGSDGRVIREVAEFFGCRTGLVPLASLGSVSENARRLAAWLAQQRDEKLILVSLSKGGADLKLALQSPGAPRLFRNVLAWINVCGPLDGSLMADWILSSRLRAWLFRFQYWIQRRDFGFISELRHAPPSTLNFPLRPPPGMRMISLVGFPLRRHMTTPFSRFCHRTLSACGPNDGTVLLSDVSQWPGEIYPVWGTDHYFRPENRARELIGAVLSYLTTELKNPPRQAKDGAQAAVPA